MADHEIGPKEEYQSLRQELLESKRYVFERPLLIAAAGVAALSAFKDVQAAAVPLLVAGLLLFNLWFTVNRLYSAGRIVAYIQVQLEAEKITPWKGWETSLREYRKWIKRPGASDIVNRELDREAVPDALLYYPAIHQLHIGIALLALTSSSFVFSRSPSPASVACLVATVLLIAWFTVYAIRYRPRRCGLQSSETASSGCMYSGRCQPTLSLQRTPELASRAATHFDRWQLRASTVAFDGRRTLSSQALAAWRDDVEVSGAVEKANGLSGEVIRQL